MNQTLHTKQPCFQWDAAIQKQIGLILALLVALGPTVTPAKAQAPDAVPIIITVPPRHYIAPPAPPQISVVQQSNPCITGYADSVLPRDIGDAQLTTVANRGIEEYIKANRIPMLPALGGCSETTAMRLLRHKRNDARTGAFLAVLTAAVKPAAAQTAEEKAVMLWMTTLVRHKWQMAAGNAYMEYVSWRANPCFYVPPDGAKYDPGPSCPGDPSSVLAGPIPLAFTRIGATQAYPALRTPQGGSAARATAAALSDILQTIEAGQVSGTLATLAPLAGTMGASLAQFSSGNPTGVAVSATRAALFPEVEASAAIQMAINLVTAQNTAQYTAPDISAMVKTEAGIQEVFAVFIETTLFNGPDPAFPVPAKGTNAKRLTVRQVIDNVRTDTDVFEYRAWDWSIWSAYIDQGWFVHAPKAGGQSRMDYTIHYKGADGNNWLAQMNGDEFVMSDAGGRRSYRSPGLRYIHQGTRVVALLNPRPPLFLVHTKPGGLAENGRQESRIDYIGWDGKEWSATLDTRRVGFNLRQRGDAVEYFDHAVKYVSWDGLNWTAYLHPDVKQFFHVKQGATTGHQDVIMNYRTWKLWKGENLTARIQ